jgi:hypothetical protein
MAFRELNNPIKSEDNKLSSDDWFKEPETALSQEDWIVESEAAPPTAEEEEEEVPPLFEEVRALPEYSTCADTQY